MGKGWAHRHPAPNSAKKKAAIAAIAWHAPRNRYARDQKTRGQEPIVAPAGRSSHHGPARWLRTETERGDHVGAEIDGENLDDGQRERDPRERERQVRHQLRNVRRQDVRQELADVVEDGTSLFDAIDDACEVVVQQDHIRRFAGDVGPGDAHCDPDVGRPQRGRVIDAVSGHGNDLPLPLKRRHHPQLLVRGHARADDFGRIQRELNLRIRHTRKIVAGQQLAARRRAPDRFRGRSRAPCEDDRLSP